MKRVATSERLERMGMPEPNSGCMLFLGSLNSYGYGRLKVHGKYVFAHRASYELERGAIPEGLQIDHLCRNRACIHPPHLEAVTPRVNTLRAKAAAANNARRTRCYRGHQYTPDNTLVMNNGARRCRTCDPLRHKRAMAAMIERAKVRRENGLLAPNPDRPACKWGHPFTEANTFFDRAGVQCCRACSVIRTQRYRSKKAVS